MTKWEEEAQTWKEAQREERAFWDDCRNTFGEELKQQLYMRRMGFYPLSSTYGFDMKGRSVLDVGGGPVSVLLKCINLNMNDDTHRAKVIDPCEYPEWVYARYRQAGIAYEHIPAEEMNESGWDVGLMYNCLQHVVDPKAIVRKLIAAARVVKIFEWIDVPPHPGHPHQLRAEDLERWTGRKGEVELFNGLNECYGLAWYLR
jgi:2-polyprenyl-3-methyl-5-hydroxy-6-metoxy-1,4-benzoquinol methylase